MTARLVTIGPSHYCEKARWALELAGVDYVEDKHPPLLHLPYVRRAGGRRYTPLLAVDGRVFGDSTDILAWIQDLPTARWRPYDEGGEAAAIEDELDEVLGPHARRIAYGFILPDRALTEATLLIGASRVDRALFRVLRGAIVGAIRRSLRVDDAGVQRSRARVTGVFDRLAERLADGRQWLVDDRFTAADLTLAALAAPLVSPPGYLPLHALPPELEAELARWRETPAGSHALRAWATYRRTPAPSPEHRAAGPRP